MLDKLFSWLWVNHPRLGQPDACLTFASIAVLTCTAKVLLNDVTVSFMGRSLNCGHVDATVIAAMLTPTLAAYYARKKDDPPGGPNGVK